MVVNFVGHGAVRYEIYSLKSIALFVLVPRPAYHFITCR